MKGASPSTVPDAVDQNMLNYDIYDTLDNQGGHEDSGYELGSGTNLPPMFNLTLTLIENSPTVISMRANTAPTMPPDDPTVSC